MICGGRDIGGGSSRSVRGWRRSICQCWVGWRGEPYLRGLMLDGKRKSMQPRAERVESHPAGMGELIPSMSLSNIARRNEVADRVAGMILQSKPRGGGISARYTRTTVRTYTRSDRPTRNARMGTVV